MTRWFRQRLRTTVLVVLLLTVLGACHERTPLPPPFQPVPPAPPAAPGPGGARPHDPALATIVAAALETTPVPSADDAADDPAIWVNPADPERSVVMGTDKAGGLAVYDLSGRQLQYLPDGQMNNVDVRDGFGLAGSEVALVTAGDRSDNSIAIYRIDPATLTLQDVAARVIHPGIETYGSCMYRNPQTGALYYFVASEEGQVEQWELFAAGTRVDGRRVRSFVVGSQTEGCVVDDQARSLYLSEEAVGIWRYAADPDGGSARTAVDSTASGQLVPDVEGLALAAAPDGTGYLVASSQGDNSFALYRRDGDNRFVGKFRVSAGQGVDGVEETDGIDVTTAGLGSRFPSGLFVAQDGSNDDGNQNFKFVPWGAVVGSA